MAGPILPRSPAYPVLPPFLAQQTIRLAIPAILSSTLSVDPIPTLSALSNPPTTAWLSP